MRFLVTRLKGLTELLLLAMLLLVGLGSNAALADWFSSVGGGSSGFTGRPLITVEIRADKTRIPVNLAGLGPNPSLPYTSTITAVVKRDGRLFPTDIQLDLAPTLASGALVKPDDLKEGFRSLPIEKSSGLGTAFFHATSTPGEVIITASARDPATGQSVSASVKITVVDERRSTAAITFTGAYVNAVLAGQSRFGGADTPIQDGSYSRVVSVVVNDANGNPVNPNTQINFFLVDGPIFDYPATPGAFFIAGNNGDPADGKFQFDAAGESFATKGVAPFHRLVLGNPVPDIRIIESVLSASSLAVQSTNRTPFPAKTSNVPYLIGFAQSGAILSPSFTNLQGVASTVVTYPVERVGQTAVLLACTADMGVCGMLNTCDGRGRNCKSVYLGVTNGKDRVLTVSKTTLGPNRSTAVEMCLRDVNFIPLPATEIRYNIGSSGPAKVAINSVEGNLGSISTGANGCVTLNISSSGQLPGGQPIELQFTSDYVADPAKITIKSPGAGKLDGLFNCEFNRTEGTGKCKGTLRLTDDEGSPMGGVLITTGQVVAPGEFVLTYNPSEGVFGKTDASGQVQVGVELKSPGAYTFPFQTTSGGTATFTLNVNVAAPGTLEVELKGSTDAPLGLPYGAVLQAKGGIAPYSWSLLSGSLPPGLSLRSDGSISGTPTQEGTFSFAAQVKDKNGLTGSAAFTITVGKKNVSPLELLLNPVVAAVDAPYNGLVSAKGGAEPYSFTLLSGTLPPGLTLKPDGTISGTPTAVGTYVLSVKGTDANGLTGTGNFTVVITSASPILVSIEGGRTGKVGVPFSDGVVTAAGGSSPYTFREITNILATAGLSLSPTGAITGTPTQTGAFTFTAEATDKNGMKGRATLTVTISESGGGAGSPLTLALNTLPEATAGTPYSSVVGTASGGKAPYTWTIESRGSLPSSISLSSGGVLSGTFGAAGTYNFVVRVSDTSNPVQSSIANVTVKVQPGSNSGGGVTPTQLTLLTSSPDLPSSGQNPVTLTAIARDSGGVLLKDVKVNFQIKSGDGTLQVTQGTTDETGTAKALLSTAGNQRNRALIVGASAGAVIGNDVTVNVAGTTLEVSGATSGTIPLSTVANPNPVKLTFALKDSAGKGIAGASLVVTGAPGGSRNVVTNASGLADLDLQFSAAGTYSINAFWDNNPTYAVTSTLPLNLTVSSDSLTVIVTDSVAKNPDGTPLNDVIGITPGFGNVQVEWRRNGALVPGATIKLSTNKGTLGLTTGPNPLVTTISSTVPGAATITATGTSADPAISPVTIQKTIQFIATAPSTLTVQANPSSISVNVPPATSSQSTITATVRDAVENPVANVDVAFEIIQDVSGGSLSAGTAKTNFSGQASVVYFAGSSPTQENGVIIRATVAGLPVKTATLTVSKREVFITLGTGNTVAEPDPTTYALPYNVLVNDIVGGAAQGAVVTLNAIPSHYRKGQYYWNGVVWVPVVTATCPNEDINKNGILDPGEDLNGNNRLDPGNVVTTSVASITTDKDGFGKFDVLYAQQYASWINNDLIARTKVGGSEDVELSSFILPPSAADVGNAKVSPPGATSPFGVLPICTVSADLEKSLALKGAPGSVGPGATNNPPAPLVLALPAGDTTLSPEQAVSGSATVEVVLPGFAGSLTGTSILAEANSVVGNVAISTATVLSTTGSIAVFPVTVKNGSTTDTIPVSSAPGGTTVGSITFWVGDAKIVMPIAVKGS